MTNCLSRRDQKVHLIFQKLCPLGHQDLLFKWFQNENGVFIEMNFKIQNQTFEQHFHFHFFALTL